MGCGKPNTLHRVIDNSEDALVPIQIKRRTFERFRKHHNMFRPVDDDVVSYDQILNRMMDCFQEHNDAYTYKYGFNY